MDSKHIKKNRQNIYIDVTSLNFWWNVYELANKTGWEDIIIYDKNENEFQKIAHTCICTKEFLQNYLEDLENDPDEKKLVENIRKFLIEDEIQYNYYYNNVEWDTYEELPYYNLQVNENNDKPWFVEVWHPNKTINVEVIKESVTAFCERFLNIAADEVIFKEIMSFEEAKDIHKKYIEMYENKQKKIDIMDEIVDELEKKWNQSREEVLKRLKQILD